MKTLSLVLALVLTLTAAIVFGTTQVQAADFTLCTNLSEAAGAVALARDEGLSPGEVFQFGLESGLDADLISAMINLVYVDMVNSSPQHIENTFMAYCLSN